MCTAQFDKGRTKLWLLGATPDSWQFVEDNVRTATISWKLAYEVWNGIWGRTDERLKDAEISKLFVDVMPETALSPLWCIAYSH